MATHSSVPAWRTPGTGEPGELPSMGSHKVGHDRSYLAAAASWYIKKTMELTILHLDLGHAKVMKIISIKLRI